MCDPTLRRRAIAATLVALAATRAATAAESAPRRHLELTYSCEIADIPAGAKTVDLWIPMPQSDERQTVRLVQPTDVAPAKITADKKFGNRIYYRRFVAPFDRQPLKVELVYDIDVGEWTVPEAKSLASTKQVAAREEFAPYLGNVKMIPLEGKISEMTLQASLPKGEPLRAGRKLYDFLIDRMVYNYLAPGAGEGDAVWACDSKTGDCTDYHSIFIGVCRTRGIPADHVFGLPMPVDKPQGEVRYAHCWARFWVADVGWIPIDASQADKFPKLKEYYFGTLGPTCTTLSHGRDVVLEPPQQGPPLNMFEHPYVEVDGQQHQGMKWIGRYRTLDTPAKP